MVKDISPSQWSCTGKSVCGASHIRSGLPNQDAIDWYPTSSSGTPLILAVSDGHGSAKSFRSDCGSQLAVKTAIEVIREFLSDPSIIKNMPDRVKRLLPDKITTHWQQAVLRHLAEHPLTEKEKETLLSKEGEKGLHSIKQNTFLAYGATILAVAITEDSILYLQLGDGDILRIDEEGKTDKPLVRNPDLIANETTSLCMETASREFQIEIETQNQSTPKPALILLSTDGYANSYASDDEFFKIGQDYLREIRESGLEALEQQLDGLLTEISMEGSGDDITIGVVKRIEVGDRGNLDRQQSVSQEIQDNGGGLVEVHSHKRPGKTVKGSRGLDRKLIAIIPLFLAVGSTCLSTYLFWRLAAAEATLAKVQKTNGDSQQKIKNLEQKLSQIEAKQNNPAQKPSSTNRQSKKGK